MNALRTAAVIAAAALTLVGCVARENPSTSSGSEDAQTEQTSAEDTGAASDPGEATGGDCAFSPDGSGDASVGLPPDDGPADATTLSFTTSAGPITIEFDADRAPCTVQSMAFLAGEGYFDGTNCHRLTTMEGLRVLQCGDPKGDGSGGPGYVVPDEFPTDLKPSQDGQTVVYERGMVAMANAGPGTTGSQFFLVYDASTLPPDYTMFGTMDEASLKTLDKVASGGVEPGSDRGPEDGTPVTSVEIESAEVA